MNIRVIVLGGMLYVGALLPDMAAADSDDVDFDAAVERSEEGDMVDSVPGQLSRRRFARVSSDFNDAFAINLNLTRVLQGDADRGLEGFLDLLGTHPDEALILTNIASIHASRGEIELARLLLGDALACDPDFRLAEGNLRLLTARNDPPQNPENGQTARSSEGVT